MEDYVIKIHNNGRGKKNYIHTPANMTKHGYGIGREGKGAVQGRKEG